MKEETKFVKSKLGILRNPPYTLPRLPKSPPYTLPRLPKSPPHTSLSLYAIEEKEKDKVVLGKCRGEKQNGKNQNI
jgi:hypothetical protein